VRAPLCSNSSLLLLRRQTTDSTYAEVGISWRWSEFETSAVPCGICGGHGDNRTGLSSNSNIAPTCHFHSCTTYMGNGLVRGRISTHTVLHHRNDRTGSNRNVENERSHYQTETLR
jgi:hypothetical protein